MSPSRPRLLCVYQHAPTPGAPGIYRHRLYFQELVRRGFAVVLVSTPINYMTGNVPARYRGRPYTHESIDGIIIASWPYHVTLRQGSQVWHVDLHDGTVINPTGLTLRRGMRVRIDGYRKRDGAFEANVIDLQRRGYRR